jgi:oxygen-dependent protoporphyrinogen oxidase
MMAPTKLLPIATTPVLSWLGKLRAGLELFIPARKDDVDESMANFVRRRLGREVFERLVEPLVSGVYAADMEKLSVFATLPRFREMERNDGSLIRAMKKQLAANKAAHLAEQSGARFSMFVTLRNGLSALAETLAQRLPSDSLKLNRNVTGIKKLPDGSWIVESRKVEFPAGRTDFQTVSCWPVPFRQEDGDSGDAECSSIRYDAVILALPVHESAELLRQPLPELAAKLSQIKHEGTAIATLAFDAGQVKQIFRGMGFVVPKIEHNPILAGSFSSLKYGHRAPSDKFLLRIFAGGARASDLVELPDQQLVPILLNEMRKILKIDGSPLFSTVSHWPRTMPQYHVGHRELVKEIEWLTDAEKSLGLAGNAFHGVGIPNCIQSGFQAAEKLAASCRYFPDSIGGGMNEE